MKICKLSKIKQNLNGKKTRKKYPRNQFAIDKFTINAHRPQEKQTKINSKLIGILLLILET